MLRLVEPLAGLFDGMFRHPAQPVSPRIFDTAANDPDPWVRATAMALRGHQIINVGLPRAEAEADFAAAAKLYAGLGERWGMAFTIGSLASLEGARGDHAAALAHNRQAVELADELGSTQDMIQFRFGIARSLWLLGDRTQAKAAMAQAHDDAERLGLSDTRAYAAWMAGDLARLDGDIAGAWAMLDRAVELADLPGMPPHLMAVILGTCGLVAAEEGDLARARSLHLRALELAWASVDAPIMAHVLTGFADLAMRESDPPRAAKLLGAGTGIRGTADKSVVDEARIAEQARAALGEARYSDAHRAGRSVTMSSLDSVDTLITGA